MNVFRYLDVSELHLADVHSLITTTFFHVYLVEDYVFVSINDVCNSFFKLVLFFSSFSKTAFDLVVNDYDSSCFNCTIPFTLASVLVRLRRVA